MALFLYFTFSLREYDLFVISGVPTHEYSVESIARICVSGLILDPEVPTSSLFIVSNFFPPKYTSAPVGSISTVNIEEELSRSESLYRGLSLKRLYKSFVRPFTLPKNATTMPPPIELSAARGKDYVPVTHSHLQPHNSKSRFPTPSGHTFFGRAFRSDIPKSEDETITLPFRLNIRAVRQKLTRNFPYLRQSWGRVDFIAVVSFWVSFILASAGVERGVYHIGIFRALSVLRIARLLAITSGTTVSPPPCPATP